MESKKYPIGGYAPGNYSCTCCKCGTKFSGDKKAVECEQCAVSAKEKFDALSPDEQAEVIKRNIEEVNKAFSDWTKKPDVNLAIVGHGKPALYYPGSYYQPLFDLMRHEHGTILTESALTDIIEVVEKMRGKQPGPRWVKGDYERLYDQLKANPEKKVACFVDYYWDRDKTREPLRDICAVRGDTLEFNARGIGYGGAPSWFDERDKKEAFLDECVRLNVEWLDEQPAAGREEDAVAFVERALREGWETSHDRKGWMKHSDDTPYVLTTAELYKLFKQHNP